MNNRMKKASLAAAAGTAIGATMLGAGSTSAAATNPGDVVTIKGTCGQTFHPVVWDGEAAWTITCGGGKVRVHGWVKDTNADGKAAEVYGTWNYDGASFGTVRAGGKGKKVNFDKSHKGSSVSLYLRVV